MPFYRFSATSTATDDGYLVFKPNDLTNAQPGRWLLIRDSLAVNDTATLASIPPAARSPNLPQYVQAAQKWFAFQLSASTAPGTVTPITGPGVWVPQDQQQIIPPYKRQINWEQGIRSGATFRSIIPLPPIIGSWTQGQKSGAVIADVTIPPIVGTWAQGQRTGAIATLNAGNSSGTWTQGQKSGAVIAQTTVITNDDLLDMTTVTRSSINSRATTKPTTSPGAPESVGFVIEEDFQDLSFLALPDNRIIDASTSAPTACKIKRTGYWRWVTDISGNSWEWISGEILLRVDSVSGNTLEDVWNSTPTNLLIRPDFHGQLLKSYQQPYSGSSSTVAFAVKLWIATETSNDNGTLMQVPGATNRWWTWEEMGAAQLVSF